MADIVKGFRDAIQDLLVPEMKAMRAEMASLKEVVKQNSEAIQQNAAAIQEMRQEMNDRFLAVQKEMDARFAAAQKERAALQKEMEARFAAAQKERDERFAAVLEQIAEMRGQIGSLAKVTDQILNKLDVNDRLTRLEERVDLLMHKLSA